MIIYIYQGMMALGKGGGSIMGELRGKCSKGKLRQEVQEETLGGGGVKQMLKGWHQKNCC